MFVQHPQLKQLNVAAEKITRLHVAQSSVQLAFSGFPPQLCKAFLLSIEGNNRALVVVAYYLMESRCSVFFVPKQGEVAVEKLDATYEDGWSFVESMGFVLTETDYHLKALDDRKQFLAGLPICQSPQQTTAERRSNDLLEKEITDLRECCLESFGRFLSSL